MAKYTPISDKSEAEAELLIEEEGEEHQQEHHFEHDDFEGGSFQRRSFKSTKQAKPTKEEKLTWKKFVSTNSKVVPVLFGAVFVFLALLFCFGWLGAWTALNREQRHTRYPIVLTTWNFVNATKTAFETISAENTTALDAIEKGCNYCEDNPDECDFTVGYGGSPNDLGETTLDAMIMWAPTFDVGSVGCLKRVKNAISVARKVLELTDHTMLVGDDATNFATEIGFPSGPLNTTRSTDVYNAWLAAGCVPNYWRDPEFAVCPPLDGTPPSSLSLPALPLAVDPNDINTKDEKKERTIDSFNHDTIGMVAIDKDGNLACGTSSNGLEFKIHGRVGDSPIPGAGAYCDQEVGGAAASGDGDVMMRFLPSMRAVEDMRRGFSPQRAAEDALQSILKYYPNASAAIIVLSKTGKMGAASIGFEHFTYNYQRGKDEEPTVHQIESFNIEG